MSLAFLVGVSQVFFLFATATPPWPSPYWDIPGDYCRAKYPDGRCCQGRQDPCSVPILGTLCYCDTFCNRTENSDCCPDYFTHCEGLPELAYAVGPPEQVVRPEDLDCLHGEVTSPEDSQCFANGRSYSTRETVQANCNTCRCQVSPKNPTCMELLCETRSCLLDQKLIEELMEGFRGRQYSWRPAQNYSEFWGRSLSEGLSRRLGTAKPEQPVSAGVVKDMSAIKFRYKEDDLPQFFDARQKWPGKIQGVKDQGWCAASWAFSTSSVASDRFSIEGQTDSPMSPQALISCDTQGQAGCRGGHVDRAWNYLRRFGTVPESCYPFTSAGGYDEQDDDTVNGVLASDVGCLLPRFTSSASAIRQTVQSLGGCTAIVKRKKLFRTQPAYKVGRRNSPERPRLRETDIMFEIMTRGPVQALMEVHSDFFLYESGIYHKTNLADPQESGFHSVKIIGWGEEEGIPYWLCMNSWGSWWGESGLFRILRGSNECHIEEFVVGVWAQTARSHQRDRRRRHNHLREQRRRRHRRRLHSGRGTP